MASKLLDSTGEHTKYGRLCRMVVELCRDMLWELLISKIPINELPERVRRNLQKLSLNSEQLRCICKPSGDLPTKVDVDISILYTILRNICPKIKAPTHGWFDINTGNRPTMKDVKVGDDIERIHIKRNALYGHAKEARIDEKTYNEEIADIREIASRMDSRLKTGFTKYLIKLESCCMDPEVEQEYIDLLLHQKAKEEEMTARVDKVEETNEQLKASQSCLTDEVHKVKKHAKVQDGQIKVLQDACTGTEESIKDLQTKDGMRAQDVGQLKETVKSLERSPKRTAAKINIIQQFSQIHQTSTVSAADISDSSGDSTDRSDDTNAAHVEVAQASKGSYASALTQNLPATPNQNVNVNYTNVNINVNSNAEDEPTRILCKGRVGHFILVTQGIGRNKCLEALALVPWTAVFDFDPNSRTTGLLSVVEHKISELTNRSLHINCLEDHNVNRVTENSTHWMFCRGCRENSNSRYTDDDWQENYQLKLGVKSFIRQLNEFSSGYTNYKIVVIWPTDDTAIKSMYKITDKLQKSLRGQLIVIDTCESISHKSRSFQTVLSSVCETSYSQVSLKLEEVCKAVSRCQAGKFELLQSQYQLPTADRTNMINMTDKEASWLEEDLVILYLNKRHETRKQSAKKLRQECDEFFKGGTLPWNMWYEVGAGHVDAKRDCMDALIDTLTEDYIRPYKSGMITLHHAPGSGGTTLAQRTLWELRKATPCVQTKLRTNATLNDTVNRLQFLHEKTGRPLLLLIDGEEDQRVRTLQPHLQKMCVVVLNLQRYPYPMQKTINTPTCFWLPDTLSIDEANMVALKFQAQCSDDEKKNTIEEMADDVRNGAKRSIFEFGLAAFTYQFKGIETYVKGYLSLCTSKGSKLQQWQIALGMLSLAYYYGHIGLPCQFFVDMLDEKVGKTIYVTDFPKCMQNLIVRDTSENRNNIIRISHYYVAKEILEQILPWPRPRLNRRQETLCIADKKALQTFVIRFIKECENNDRGDHGKFMIQILTRTFIIREEKLHTDKNNHGWKIEKVSQIFQDLEMKPLYSEMFAVMQQLTISFPKDPHFHAHLGRFYTIFKPEKEKDAERCFKKALDICNKMSRHQNVEEMPHHVRSTYTITHSMCANMFKTRTGKITGFNLNQRKPKCIARDGQFEEIANKLLETVKEGRKHFQQWRVYDPDVENMQFSYLGEIQICLMFCDFLYRQGGHQDITQFIEETDSIVSGFAIECIYQIDELFLEFFSTIEPDDEISDQVVHLQKWYYALFKNDITVPGRVRLKQNCAQNQRLQIALLKLQYRKDNIYGVLENIESISDIQRIIASFEEIFKDVHDNGTVVTRSSLDQDYREWLVAVRHDLLTEAVGIEDAIEQVLKWHRKFRTPLSKFYLFAMKSILGFGNKESLGNTQMLIEAQSLKAEIVKQTKFIVKSRHPREWLGMGPGMRQLVPSTRFYGQKEGCKNYVKPGTIDPDRLALMKGTIGHPNENPNSGFISLDLGTENNVSVHVHYVPLNFNMHFKTFANERVEFNLGFSFTFGYEAYNVKRLQKLICKECKLSIEATSRDLNVKCVCGYLNPVERDCK